MRNLKQKAFTMAEAILVMAILGIIATIMISTLKPAQFKEEALLIAAKKVLNEIDNATTQILVNDSVKGKMTELYKNGTDSVFSFKDDCAEGVELYKKYLLTKRDNYVAPEIAGDYYGWIVSGDGESRFHEYFFLKDGSLIGFECDTGVDSTWSTYFPGENIIDDNNHSHEGIGTYVRIAQNKLLARIIIDVNGVSEPNYAGKDIFKIPLSEIGILYDPVY